MKTLTYVLGGLGAAVLVGFVFYDGRKARAGDRVTVPSVLAGVAGTRLTAPQGEIVVQVLDPTARTGYVVGFTASPIPGVDLARLGTVRYEDPVRSVARLDTTSGQFKAV